MNKIIYKILLIIFYIFVLIFGYLFIKTVVEDYKDHHPKIVEVQDGENETENISQEDNITNEIDELEKESKDKNFFEKIYDKIISLFTKDKEESNDKINNKNDKSFFDKFYDNIVDFFTFGKKDKEDEVEDSDDTIESDTYNQEYTDDLELNNSNNQE